MIDINIADMDTVYFNIHKKTKLINQHITILTTIVDIIQNNLQFKHEKIRRKQLLYYYLSIL